MAWAA